ncbi:MAG: Crp/Fnr family transcriptional regulator [Rhodospirillales bacterium]|nr:Crp/Fnr family transcriptional regulator [Rhodospirillales bacterium]MBO6785874.1 Crp/Fnr family transcriptional regulator [Rhodospirillales bacterium]
MSDRFLTTLAELPGRTRRFARGETLFLTGDAVTSVFLVAAGSVELVRRDADGHSIVLHRAAAGSVLAEASLFAGAYHCDAVATSSGAAHVVPRPRVLAALEADAGLALAIAESLAHDVQAARARSEVLVRRTVSARLDGWLALNGQMPEKGAWHGIAAEIGVSPEALYRELACRRKQRGLP